MYRGTNVHDLISTVGGYSPQTQVNDTICEVKDMHLESVWAYLSVPDKKRYEMHRLKIWEGKVKDIIRKVMAYKFVTQFTAVEIRHPRVASKHGQYIKLQQIDLDFMTPTDFTFLKSNLLKEKSEFPVNLEPKPNVK